MIVATSRDSGPVTTTHAPHVFTTPPGTLDYFGDELRQRRGVEAVLRRMFLQHGVDELQTPGLEFAGVFSGHHGEGEQLLFRVIDRNGIEHVLPYDNTVPFCRWAAAHPELQMPLGRFTIREVYRDDKPDTGHFRSFTQCDYDVLGDSTRAADVNVAILACSGLLALGVPDFFIRLNHRGLIRAIAAVAGISSDAGVLAVQRALDKADKYTKGGLDGIQVDLSRYGIGRSQIGTIMALIEISGRTELERLAKIANMVGNHPAGRQAVAELREIMELLPAEMLNRVVVDLTLARGADYYTGFILEGVIRDVPVGSVLGGGRFDNLVERLGGQPTPAVGFAFGLDRLLVALGHLGLLAAFGTSERVLVVQQDPKADALTLGRVASLRDGGHHVCFLHHPDLDVSNYASHHGFATAVTIKDGALSVIHNTSANGLADTVRAALSAR